LLGLSPGQQVASSTDEPPDIILQLPVVTGAIGQQDVNVDELGNLWFTVNQSGTSPITINKYLLKNILASAVIPTPDLTIAVPNLGVTSECGCSCFDRNGNLWTMNGTHGGAGQASFLKYGFKAYGSPGGVATTSVLLDPQTATTRMSNQQDFVFDAEGNIWGSCAFTGNAGGPNAGFFKVSASALATSSVAPIVPAIYWSGSNIGNQPALSGDVIAISPTGFIFTSNLQGNNIRAWSPTTATGNPAPAIVLTSATFNGPYGITFDGSGNLWVANGLDNRVMRIPRGQLGATGVVVPDVIFNQNSVDLTGKMTFCRNPDRSASQPSGLPLAP
jgi:streptogramin lyase